MAVVLCQMVNIRWLVAGSGGAINKKGEIVYSVIYTKEKLYKKFVKMLNQTNSADAKSRVAD